ncbi:hypothetical protein A6A29_35730 [Streptomyces sp. TSRI0281]|nr:hypothetical protein A6A29_35730 [Streptomyces sp. TSRI0281]
MLSTEKFVVGATNLIASLGNAFLHDDDPEADLYAVLGASAGPTGLAGARRPQKEGRGFSHRSVHRLAEKLPKPGSAAVTELGRCVTRAPGTLDERRAAIGLPSAAALETLSRRLASGPGCGPTPEVSHDGELPTDLSSAG